MSRIIPGAAMVFLCAFCVPAAAEVTLETFQKLTRSVIKIEAMNPDGSVSIGTGVVVGRDLVATNCHVTRYARSVEAVQGAIRRTVESQDSDMHHDLCLLRVPLAGSQAAVPIRRAAPKVGEAVFAVGFIYGVAPRLNEGEVNGLHDFDRGKVIQSSTPFTSGASGGGLFDSEGRLVGIVTFRYRAGGAWHFSLPANWVIEAAARYRGRPVAPLAGEPFWQRPPHALPHFLKAARLEADQDWHGLDRAADLWVDAEPANASAWYALGKAAFRRNQNGRSVSALRRAVALDPEFAEAWYALGLVFALSGDEVEVNRVRRVLRGLESRLAANLDNYSGACDRTPITVC